MLINSYIAFVGHFVYAFYRLYSSFGFSPFFANPKLEYPYY